MFKKIFTIFALFIFTNLNTLLSQDLSFKVENTIKQHEKIKSLFLVVGEDDFLEKLSKIIKPDLEFTDQLDVELNKTKYTLSVDLEKKLFNKGTSLCIYLKSSPNSEINLIVRELSSNITIFQKDFNPKDHKNDSIFLGHKISDELLPILTGESSICLSSIAYSKMLSTKHQVICVTDCLGKREKTIVSSKTINVLPCWHSQAPVLFYSQFTKLNTRLMSVDLKTKENKIICSYPGVNMQPSFSKDGTKAALCLSGDKNAEIYLYDRKICQKNNKFAFSKITNNGGTNVSPILLENDNLIYCSDFKTGSPQIFYLNKKENKTIKLTNGKGYCAAPSYCSKTNTLVYTRLIKGTFQLFSLNLDNFQNLQEKQLTFNQGDKHEPSFSECGRFVAFSYECLDNEKKYKTNQIAVLNCSSGKIHTITTGKEPKNYPRWNNQPFYL